MGKIRHLHIKGAVLAAALGIWLSPVASAGGCSGYRYFSPATTRDGDPKGGL